MQKKKFHFIFGIKTFPNHRWWREPTSNVQIVFFNSIQEIDLVNFFKATKSGIAPNLHFPHLHRTQIYTNQDLHGTFIYTAQIYTNSFSHIDSKKPNFTQPNFTQKFFLKF